MTEKNIYNNSIVPQKIKQPIQEQIIENKQINEKKEISNIIKIEKQNNIINNEIIGSLIIPKINLNNNLYNIKSKNNNIEKNVTILKIIEHNNKQTIIIAAHSGSGDIAYFKNLHKLNINDEVILNYNNLNLNYKIHKIYEQEKNGYITIKEKNYNQLILTTCSKNKNKQLIIECNIKES